MATLKIQKVSKSVSALSKMQEYEICFSGFPKKGCQGCHISKRAHNFLTRCTSFWSIFCSYSYAIVEILGNRFGSKNELWCVFLSASNLTKVLYQSILTCAQPWTCRCLSWSPHGRQEPWPRERTCLSSCRLLGATDCSYPVRIAPAGFSKLLVWNYRSIQ